MSRNQKGFTLIELMIVVVIIGILAAIAIPNFIAMQNRAKEGSTKANMHTLQLAAEDYGVAYDGVYATTISLPSLIADRLPGNFKNPFNATAAAFASTGVDPMSAKSSVVTPACTSNNPACACASTNRPVRSNSVTSSRWATEKQLKSRAMHSASGTCGKRSRKRWEASASGVPARYASIASAHAASKAASSAKGCSSHTRPRSWLPAINTAWVGG